MLDEGGGVLKHLLALTGSRLLYLAACASTPSFFRPSFQMWFGVLVALQEPNFSATVDYSRGLGACGFSTQNAGTWTIKFEVSKHFLPDRSTVGASMSRDGWA